MNKILKFYYALPHDSKLGIFSKVLNRITARVVKRYFDIIVPKQYDLENNDNSIGINTTEFRDKKYIVSLTSFPARVQDIWISIETILRQTFKPDAIILWLSEEQFKGIELPKKLTDLEKRGLTIKFVTGDIRSHKKYKYALEQYPNDYIITLDDDLYYDEGLLENLVILKKQFPDCVPTNRAHKIRFKDSKILPYRTWFHNAFQTSPSYSLLQTGGFGTLYSYEDLFVDFNKNEIFLKLAPQADDIWLKIMVLKNRKKIVTNSKYNKDPLAVKTTQVTKLVSENVINGGNDSQMQNLVEYYNLNIKDFQDEA
jgi:hypothetical protein